MNTNEKGMSKRFYAACAAMQGILSSNHLGLYCDKQAGAFGFPDTNPINKSKLVNLSYRIADELLKQENQEL